MSPGMMALGCAGTLVLIVLLAVGSVWLYFRGRHQQALREVQAKISRIQAAGEPITTEDMVKFHRVPEGTFDATGLWIAAIQAATVDAAAERPLPIFGSGKLADLRPGAPASLLPAAEQYLTTQQAAIAKTQKAAAAGGECRYPIDFSKGIGALLPHIQEARQLARILSLRLHVAVAKGDSATAIESLELQLALAQTMDHEPTLVTQLVRMAIAGMALSDLRELVGELPLSEPQLAALQRRLAALDAQRPMKDGLLGERAMGYHAFHNLSQLEGMAVLAGKDGELQRPGDLQVYLDLMTEMIEAADESPAKARLKSQQVENQLRAMVGQSNPLDRLEIVVTAQLLPATGRAFDASARLQTLRDSAVCGIAYRRHQLKYGKPPDSLAALVPEFLPAIPLDPFAPAGTPLILATDEQHYAIYSIGRDGRDDQVLLGNPESTDDDGFVAKLAVPE